MARSRIITESRSSIRRRIHVIFLVDRAATVSRRWIRPFFYRAMHTAYYMQARYVPYATVNSFCPSVRFYSGEIHADKQLHPFLDTK